jgi:hypothetical protein
MMSSIRLEPDFSSRVASAQQVQARAAEFCSG